MIDFLLNLAILFVLKDRCLLRLAVRTSPFHGEDTGSIPVGDAKILTFISLSEIAKLIFVKQSIKSLFE